MRIVKIIAALGGIVVGTQALAADPAAMDMGRWDGAYAGAFVGGADRSVTLDWYGDPVDGIRHITAGLLAGYRFQVDRFTLGFEGDIGIGGRSGAGPCDFSGDTGCGSLDPAAQTLVDGHLRATAGVVLSDRWAVFAAAGLAVAYQGGGAMVYLRRWDGPTTADEDFDRSVMFGYTVGGGVEYRPLPQWLLRAEVLYDVYDHTQLATAAAAASLPDCCAGSLSIGNAPFHFDDAMIARVALLHQFQ